MAERLYVLNCLLVGDEVVVLLFGCADDLEDLVPTLKIGITADPRWNGGSR